MSFTTSSYLIIKKCIHIAIYCQHILYFLLRWVCAQTRLLARARSAHFLDLRSCANCQKINFCARAQKKVRTLRTGGSGLSAGPPTAHEPIFFGGPTATLKNLCAHMCAQAVLSVRNNICARELRTCAHASRLRTASMRARTCASFQICARAHHARKPNAVYKWVESSI